MSRRVAAALVAALMAAAASTGCTPVDQEELGIMVSGDLGSQPALVYDKPLEVDQPVVEVLAEGTGPPLVEGEPILVHYRTESGVDGSLVQETYSTEPRAWLLTQDQLGASIHEALRGQRVGSRILHVVPDGGGQPVPTVTVFDLLPVRATGEEIPPREGLPVVVLDDDGGPMVTVPDEEPPSDLVVQPLIRGSGAQVGPGQVITVRYVALTWSEGRVYDSSWTDGALPVSFPVGVGSLLPGWDDGLLEQPVGSQVMLVVPPYLAYGGTQHELAEETLVFVVDILAVSGTARGVEQP